MKWIDATKARQGRRGHKVLFMLIASVVLAGVVLTIVELFFRASSS